MEEEELISRTVKYATWEVARGTTGNRTREESMVHSEVPVKKATSFQMYRIYKRKKK